LADNPQNNQWKTLDKDLGRIIITDKIKVLIHRIG